MSVDENHPAGSQSPENPHSWRISRPFGTGVKRKQIHFVPASAEEEDGGGWAQEAARDSQPNRGPSVAEFYLSLVLPSGPGLSNASSSSKCKSTPSNKFQDASTSEAKLLHGSSSVMGISSEITKSMMPSQRDYTIKSPSSIERLSVSSGSSDGPDAPEGARIDGPASSHSEDTVVRPAEAVVEPTMETPGGVDEICSTCNSRVTNWESHVRTTAHMFSSKHSKTPHHWNRQSEGYKHMVKLGWDPDSRDGLGAKGQGTRYPVKATPKKDNLGIGAKPSKSIRDNADSVSDTNPKRPRLLTAKQMQRLEKAERAARQDLHDYLRH
ncbi:hypothetical protein TWF730_000908 [Orbilia blumenaviensis]|uniref:G-patch domain-containing protein n=1 Tax=Orbilia blumenaviensis TaxID=1796055 RepID=A0AAV9VR35_9PEZI